jgi:phosphoesterase RecJ-like protein
VTEALGAAVSEAAATLRDAERIVALGHVGPDGDALGSALGLALAARAAGKDAVVSFGEPFVVPRAFRYLDLGPLVAPGAISGAIDVLVACDTADVERLGSAAVLVERAKRLVVVDHHRTNDGFGDVLVIDPEAAATAQLIVAIVDALAWPLTPAAATALYTGMVTDTGRFQYSSTTPEVHRVTARLVEAGAVPDDVARHLYEEAPFGYLKVAAEVLGRAVLDAPNRLVWSVLTERDLAGAGVGYEDADGLIDLLRIAEETDVACLLKVLEPGRVKGSLRSRGRVDVAAIAVELGGGGHHNAAGFTFHGEVAEAIARITAALA